MTLIEQSLYHEFSPSMPTFEKESEWYAVTMDADGYVAIWAIEEPIDVMAGMTTNKGSWESTAKYVEYLAGFFINTRPGRTEVQVVTHEELIDAIDGRAL